MSDDSVFSLKWWGVWRINPRMEKWKQKMVTRARLRFWEPPRYNSGMTLSLNLRDWSLSLQTTRRDFLLYICTVPVTPFPIHSVLAFHTSSSPTFHELSFFFQLQPLYNKNYDYQKQLQYRISFYKQNIPCFNFPQAEEDWLPYFIRSHKIVLPCWQSKLCETYDGQKVK